MKTLLLPIALILSLACAGQDNYVDPMPKAERDALPKPSAIIHADPAVNYGLCFCFDLRYGYIMVGPGKDGCSEIWSQKNWDSLKVIWGHYEDSKKPRRRWFGNCDCPVKDQLDSLRNSIRNTPHLGRISYYDSPSGKWIDIDAIPMDSVPYPFHPIEIHDLQPLCHYDEGIRLDRNGNIIPEWRGIDSIDLPPGHLTRTDSVRVTRRKRKPAQKAKKNISFSSGRITGVFAIGTPQSGVMTQADYQKFTEREKKGRKK